MRVISWLARAVYDPVFIAIVGVWQAVVVLTPFSLYGFWTDVLFFLVWFLWTSFLAVTWSFKPQWVNWIAGLLPLSAIPLLITPFSLTLLFACEKLMDTVSVPQAQRLQGLCLVDQYFAPTGLPGCGMGELTTAKALVFFPLVEYRTSRDPCVHEDYGCFSRTGSWEACGY